MYQNKQNNRDGWRKENQGPSQQLKRIVSYIESGDGDLLSIFGLSGDIKFLANTGSGNKTKAHQLRRFYDYLVSIDDSLQSGGMEKNEERAAKLRLIRLIPLAAYSAAPTRKLLDQGLSEFIGNSAQAVSGKTGREFVDALRRFRDVYEALVAYSKG